MLQLRFPLSLRNVEKLLHEQGVEISNKTIRYQWNRFDPMLAAALAEWRGLLAALLEGKAEVPETGSHSSDSTATQT